MRNPSSLRVVTLSLGNVEVKAYYSGSTSGLNTAKQLAMDLSRRARLLRITLDGNRKVLYASVNPLPGEPVDDIVEAVISAAERLGRRP